MVFELRLIVSVYSKSYKKLSSLLGFLEWEVGWTLLWECGAYHHDVYRLTILCRYSRWSLWAGPLFCLSVWRFMKSPKTWLGEAGAAVTRLRNKPNIQTFPDSDLWEPRFSFLSSGGWRGAQYCTVPLTQLPKVALVLFPHCFYGLCDTIQNILEWVPSLSLPAHSYPISIEWTPSGLYLM